MDGPIVVGVDETDTARRAAFRAAELATALAAPLHLVMAASSGRSGAVNVGVGLHVDWVSAAEQFLDALIGELPTPEITRSIVLQDPATAICGEAERLHAQMIVVGNRRVQGISRVLGAIATDVARRAPCDVLISDTSADE
jgi:nucleotide-binding universal stress UspA family protein